MKKHLSRIVSNRILAVLIASFAILMAITVIFVFLYAKNRTKSMMSFYLNDLRDYAVFSMDRHLMNDTVRYTKDIESLVAEDGAEFFTDAEYDAAAGRYFLRSLEYNKGSMDEINLVDGNGIIRASTVEDYVGYDMHSGEQSTEFLCLLDGTDVFVQDIKEMSYDGKTRMRYSGAAFKNTKGFLQVGIKEDTYYLGCENYMITRIRDERVGRTGYYLLLDREQKIIGSPRGAYNGDVFHLPDDPKVLAENGRVIKVNIYGADSYVGAKMLHDDIILVIYPVAEAWETWNVAMLVLITIYAVVFAVLFVFINRLMAKYVVQGVYSLNGSLLKITKGDLNEKADYRESVEFDELSDGINYTVDRLKELIKEADERIDAELKLAARIQNSFIPHKFPAFPDREEFELFAEMIPAKEVGGDFYDYFLIDDDHLALVMADVSDKGIPAAMFMVMAKDKIHHSVMKYCTDVSAAIADVNQELLKENDAGLFVTVWLGVVTLSTGHVDYVDAGHEYPAICRAGGKFAVNEDEHSGPVAALKKMKFDAGSFDLGPEDILYLYTDGVTEANDPDGEMFRVDKMLDALNADTGASVEEIDANVRRAIDEFVKDAPQFDDTTSLVFRYKGAG